MGRSPKPAGNQILRYVPTKRLLRIKCLGLSLVTCMLTFSLLYILSPGHSEPVEDSEDYPVDPLIITARPSVCSPDSPLFHTCHIPTYMYTPYGDFDQMLRGKAGQGRVLFLSVLDKHFVAFAVNLHISSYQRHGIANFQFVCVDSKSVSFLFNMGVSCFYYKQDIEYTELTDVPSKKFNIKTHLKTKVALSALMLGYTVVMVDPDVVFFKNPSKLLMKGLGKYDMMFIDDKSKPSTSLYIARPSTASIEALRKALVIGLHDEKRLTDNEALARVLGSDSFFGDKKDRPKSLKTNLLDKDKFLNGYRYFEMGLRMFYLDNPCHTCVAVHCDSIFFRAAKIYRMRENHLWFVDTGGYYSSTTQKYMTYRNPPLDMDPNDLVKLEMNTLKAALFMAYILRRILILPAFHCGHCDNTACKSVKNLCSLNSYINIDKFDRTFGFMYREHSFLANPLVPDDVRKRSSKQILIRSTKLRIPLDVDVSEIDSKHIFKPHEPENGATLLDIKRWFTKEDYEKLSVLNFHSLHGALHNVKANSAYMSNPRFKDFQDRLDAGLQEVSYRQSMMNRWEHDVNDII